MTYNLSHMYSKDKYKELLMKYGDYASWAIWDDNNVRDTSIIEKNIMELHSKYVLLGLNASGNLMSKWSNFHFVRHDRKLRFACNNTELRGSYMTDIFKGVVEPKSSFISEKLSDEIIQENVELFNQEMKDVNVNDKTIIIVFGTPSSIIAKYFDKYFKQDYKNRVIYCYHYSYYRLTDKAWVERFLEKVRKESH